MRKLAMGMLAASVIVLGCAVPGKSVTPSSLRQSAAPTTAPNAAPSAAPARTPGPVASVGDLAPGESLLSIRTWGGMCPDGACDSSVTLRRDGSFSSEDGPPSLRTGRVSQAAIDTLAREVARADFARIKSVKFTGTCPVAYDGQEKIYTFQTAEGPQEIASCKVKIDEQSALFKAVAAVEAEMYGQ